MFDGAYFLGEVLEIGSFIAGDDVTMLAGFFPLAVFLEICVAPFYSLHVLVLDLGSE